MNYFLNIKSLQKWNLWQILGIHIILILHSITTVEFMDHEDGLQLNFRLYDDIHFVGVRLKKGK